MAVIQIFASFAGSLGFALLYNLRGKKLWTAGVSGMISWAAYLFVWNQMPSGFAANLAAAAVATIYAETMARILKTPVTVFLITGIIPLVPGGNLYYTMNYVIAKEWHLFSLYGQKTMLTAIAIAAGIMVASSLYGICASIVHHYAIKNIK
ncbi:threonine/serine exporter family protein [Anaerostipes sp. MSJ-23]|uniref:threonine/serine exporter family protein n=1 Tax=Anaerostipes sp. TaxID=1872530 RepID=UPI001C111A0A|nr:threonine/serine exporter family protein [Anaerostipes sp. MSJ-23]MBU5458955.1 threonine/serine exporter family protein [Anaerostipes sp. MSJ-23]